MGSKNNKKTKVIEKGIRLVGTRSKGWREAGGEEGELEKGRELQKGDQKVQTSSHKMNKDKVRNVLHNDYS